MIEKAQEAKFVSYQLITLALIGWDPLGVPPGDSQFMPIYGSDQNGCSLHTPSPLLKATIKWLFPSRLLNSNPLIFLDFNSLYLT